MADWCVHTGFAPDIYRSLTRRQRDEFIRARNQMNRGR